MFKFRILTLLLFLVLASCASQQTTDLSGYELIHTDSYEKQIPEIGSTNPASTIVVRRDSGITGSALRAVLCLNGDRIVNLRPGQYVNFRVKPGEHQLTLNSNGFALLPVETKALVNLSNGQTKFYRVKVVWGGGMQLVEMAQ
jgi:hypothetical protein